VDIKTAQRIGGLYSAVREIADATSHDLTLRQVLVLLHVGSSTVPLGHSQLSDAHDLNKSTVSKIVANLASKDEGTVRRPDGLGMFAVDFEADNYRNRYVTLSRRGERVLKRAVDML